MRRKNTTSEMMKSYIAQSLLLLMEQKALNDISIGEITAKAGVNRTTYYRHFESKDHIIKHYFTGILAEYTNALALKGSPNLEQYLKGMFTHLKKHKKELLLIYKNGVSHLIFEALSNLFLQKSSFISFDAELATYYHAGGIYGTFLLWFSHEMRESPAQMCKASLNVLSDSFVPILIR